MSAFQAVDASIDTILQEYEQLTGARRLEPIVGPHARRNSLARLRRFAGVKRRKCLKIRGRNKKVCTTGSANLSVVRSQ